MKKKLLIVSTLIAMLICGCGDTHSVNLTSTPNPVPPTNEEFSSVFDESTVSEDDTKEVEIILVMIAFGDTSIDDYIEQLKSDNPEKQYSVYNDEYYIQTITESERKSFLENMENEYVVDESFKDLFSNESYGEAFISMEYDDSFQHFKFYVDKEKFETNELTCTIGATISATAISDSYQAYNLIMPENRVIKISFIDNTTGETIKETE